MRDESELPARKLLFRKWRAQAVADARYTGQIACSVKLQMRLFVTPKGVQPPAVCDASATREGL